MYIIPTNGWSTIPLTKLWAIRIWQKMYCKRCFCTLPKIFLKFIEKTVTNSLLISLVVVEAVLTIVSLKPSNLQRVLTELQWNGMWFFSLAFFAVIFMEMLSDFLLVTDRCTAWKALNGNVSEAEFHNLQQIVLCENQKVSIEKKLASTILLVLMICATAAFVWFTFLA